MSLFGNRSVDTDKEKINNLLTRGVEDVFVKESLQKKLNSGRPLRVKLGFDPTGSNIHIGRAAVLRKLKAFQDLGHTVVFIVGDFTAQIGDPSDKLDKRPMLSPAVIKKNMAHYKEQVGKIIDLRRAEFHYNSKWLSKLTLKEISELAESFSVQQMLARRNFKDRFDGGVEISLREFLYPLMQGYDSLMVKADVEISGFDQLFNLKAGRTIQKHYGIPEQDVLTVQMLEGTDGRKMSTSWGNVINVLDSAPDMFGKVMSIRDDLIAKYFLLCTDLSSQEIEAQKSANPRDAKFNLATEIVSLYHGKGAAAKAGKTFNDTFQRGAVPEDVVKAEVPTGAALADVLLEHAIVKSKTEFRRLIEEGAIENMEDSQRITDHAFTIQKDTTIKVGKRRFIKIIVRS